MKFKTLRLSILNALVAMISMNAFALDAPTSADEQAAITNCLSQKLKDKTSPITQSVISHCGDIADIANAKCLGISSDDYQINFIKFCQSQLVNTECVSKKMNITLNQYTACDQEQDPGACFKRFGYTPSKIVELSDKCEKAGAK